MTLDAKTSVIVQISAAAAANALAALRTSVTEGLNLGLTKEEIRSIINLAQDVQQQTTSHTRHLTDQLLREQRQKKHEHGHGCTCGCHS